jgi:FlaA1/EpsC-like NDP-sugar epimerase
MKMRQLLTNRIIVLLHDTFMVPVAWIMAFWLRFNLNNLSHYEWVVALHTLPIVITVQMLAALWAGCYRGMWRFASLPDLIRIVKAVIIGAIIALGCIFVFNRLINVPRAVFPLYIILLTACWGGPRIIYRMLKDYFNHVTHHNRVLIIGAGYAGESLVRELLRDRKGRYQPIAFLDDDITLLGKDIHGLRVVATIDKLEKYVRRLKATMVMLAIPSAGTQQMQDIVNACDAINIPYRTLPSIADLTEDRISINALRKVEIEDLLGRDPVQLDWSHIQNKIENKTVLVTGGGGSIGSELCRQIAKLNPTKLIIVENSEYNLYQISQELMQDYESLEVICCLADVSDVKFVNHVMKNNRPEVVFHAAAYKHVPMLESQLLTAVKNNIFATRVIADLSVQYRVGTFVLVSSDKAVNPTNIMGLSKRIAEIYCQNLNARGSTHFVTVRFGNVLGSTGSVVPLFRKQLEAGGPITVTHPDMTRYFMTIPEATSLILQSYTMGEGGEIFVLDMGEPVKISYLAEQMIRLAGKIPNKDIKIEYTGIRPGEKMFEELFHGSEHLIATAHQKISLANARKVDWVTLIKAFDTIELAYQSDDQETIVNTLKELVPEYHQTEIEATQ